MLLSNASRAASAAVRGLVARAAPHTAARASSSAVISPSTINAFDVPDSAPASLTAAVANARSVARAPVDEPPAVGAVSDAHWGDEPWAEDAVASAAKDHAMFTWGASEPMLDNSPQFVRGDGVYLYDRDGAEFLDWTSQAICTNLGHTVPPAVKAAINAQLDTVPMVYSGFAMVEVRARLAKLLAELLPKEADLTGFLFPSGGNEANEAAIRIARRFTGRQKIFTRYRSYHGGSGVTLAATGDFRRNFAETGQSGFVKMADPNPFGYSWAADGAEGEAAEAEASERALRALHEQLLMEGPQTVAAIMLECVPGSGGVLLAPKGYVEGVRALCDEHGILLIADEVMTGFGRTGKMFGFEHFGIVPDVVTFAKGITGAWMPMSGVGVRRDIQEFFRTNPLGWGSTYHAHPVAMACGYETLKHLVEHDVVGTVQRDLAPVMRAEMQVLADRHACIRQGRHLGLFGCFDLVNTADDAATGKKAGDRVMRTLNEAPLPDKVVAFKQAFRAEGLTGLMRPPLLHCAPPLTITPDQLKDGFARLSRALTVLD